jgi:hypothetical protein
MYFFKPIRLFWWLAHKRCKKMLSLLEKKKPFCFVSNFIRWRISEVTLMDFDSLGVTEGWFK